MVCPGCHSTNLKKFQDGFHDFPPDFWFHCNNCGEEGCVDYDEDTLDGKRPPTKKPPYFDHHPLPTNCPIVGTPDQLRAWAKKQEEVKKKEQVAKVPATKIVKREPVTKTLVKKPVAEIPKASGKELISKAPKKELATTAAKPKPAAAKKGRKY